MSYMIRELAIEELEQVTGGTGCDPCDPCCKPEPPCYDHGKPDKDKGNNGYGNGGHDGSPNGKSDKYR